MRIQRLSYLVIAGVVAGAASLSFTAGARAACNETWKPVCGTVGNQQHTFTNACWAKAQKAKHVHKGQCKWK